MNKLHEWINTGLLGVVAVVVILVLVGGNQSVTELGSKGTRFRNGISADATAPTTGQVRGTTLTITGAATFGGGLSLTTSNTATSTLTVGCIQTVATSTATPIAMTFSSIPTTTTMLNGQTNAGYVLWKYGSCPF